MKRTSIVIISLIIVTVFTGCGKKERQSKEISTTIYSAHSAMDTADPYGSTGLQNQFVSNMTFDTLTYVDSESGEVCPELAASWEDVSENHNGGDWKVNLQHDVKFHNGSSFTADDVKFTWEYTATGAGNVVKTNAASAYVESYEIIDDYTIVFHLLSPMIDFPSYLETKIYSKEAFESREKSEACIVGTGPYYLDKTLTKSGVSYGVTRFSDYWRGLEDYPSEHIVFKEITDLNTRVAALSAGEIDFLFDVEPSAYSILKNAHGITVSVSAGANSFYLGFNYSNNLFDDLDVRKAICQAINKNDIVSIAFENGVGGQASNNFCAPSGLGYTELTNTIEYDFDKASASISSLGMKGKKLVLAYTPGKSKMAEVVQSNLTAAGLDIEMKVVEAANWSQFKASQSGYDLFIDYAAYQGALLYNFNRFFYSGGSSNVYGFQSDEYEGLQDRVSSATSWDDMLVNFATLQKWVADNIPIYPLVLNNMIVAYKDTVEGVKVAPSSNYMDLSTLHFKQ